MMFSHDWRPGSRHSCQPERGVWAAAGVSTPMAEERSRPRADSRKGQEGYTIRAGVAKLLLRLLIVGGQVAQLVEQRTENPCVVGSIPTLATAVGSVERRDAWKVHVSRLFFADVEEGRKGCNLAVRRVSGGRDSSALRSRCGAWAIPPPLYHDRRVTGSRPIPLVASASSGNESAFRVSWAASKADHTAPDFERETFQYRVLRSIAISTRPSSTVYERRLRSCCLGAHQ